MKIKKISVENIRSYENEEINFPDGSLLLSGDIGSGKSSILFAIEYALFGLQPGQRGLSLLRNNTDSGSVILEIEVQGKKVILEKKLKRSTRGITNEYASIIIDGKKEESSVTEIKTKLLELLGYPLEFIKKNNLLYRYTVFTPQEQMKQIILEDPETRLNTLRNIFGIEKYRRIRENLSVILTNLKDEIRFLQGKTASLEEEKTKAADKIKSLEEINNKKPELTKIQREKKEYREKIEADLLELQSKIKEKQMLETEIEKTKILIKTREELFSNLEKNYTELLFSIPEETVKFSQESYNFILEKIKISEATLERLNSQYIDIISNLNSLEKIKLDNLTKKERLFKIDICPTCLQDVPETHKHNILNETESLISKIQNQSLELQKEKEKMIILIQKEKSDLQNLKKEQSNLELSRDRLKKISETQAKLTEIEENKEHSTRDISILKNHLITLKEGLLFLSKFDNIIKLKQKSLELARTEERKAEISLAELNKEIELTSREIKSLQEKVNETEKIKKKLAHLVEIQEWLSTKFLSLIEFTERNVLMNLRIEFSNLFKKWFSSLVSQESLQVQLDESFTPIIIQGETEMSYDFLSGGERTAVALAYRLALNQTINLNLSKIQTHDIIILDEPTEGFSETQIDKMRDVLQELNVSQLIIVSHEQKMESFVENVIKIQKRGDISEVYEENIQRKSPKSLNNPNL